MLKSCQIRDAESYLPFPKALYAMLFYSLCAIFSVFCSGSLLQRTCLPHSVITVILIYKNVEKKICFQKCTYGLCIGATLGTCFLFSLLLPRRISCWASLHAIIYYCSISLTTSSVSAAQGSGPNMEMRKVPKKQSLPVPNILAFVCSLSA